jgi:hypothetical protein
MIPIRRKIVSSLAAGFCATLLALTSSAIPAQTQTHPKKVEPKPEPTSAELFLYIRGGLLEYSPNDRVNDNLDVSLDPTATILTVKQPDGHCDIFLGALDANTITWDVYDASDSMQTRAPLARMNIVSIPGKKARTCYDNDNNIDPSIPTTHVRFLFSWEKIPDGSGFQTRMTKGMKKLIKMCGGYAEKDIFKNP